MSVGRTTLTGTMDSKLNHEEHEWKAFVNSMLRVNFLQPHRLIDFLIEADLRLE